MDRREAERGRALVAAALAAQDEYDRAKEAWDAARKKADKARAELVSWDVAHGEGKTLVYDGRAVRVGERVTLVPIASLDPQPAPPPPPPLPPAPPPPPPPPTPTKGGKK